MQDSEVVDGKLRKMLETEIGRLQHDCCNLVECNRGVDGASNEAILRGMLQEKAEQLLDANSENRNLAAELESANAKATKSWVADRKPDKPDKSATLTESAEAMVAANREEHEELQKARSKIAQLEVDVEVMQNELRSRSAAAKAELRSGSNKKPLLKQSQVDAATNATEALRSKLESANQKTYSLEAELQRAHVLIAEMEVAAARPTSWSALETASENEQNLAKLEDVVKSLKAPSVSEDYSRHSADYLIVEAEAEQLRQSVEYLSAQLAIVGMEAAANNVKARQADSRADELQQQLLRYQSGQTTPAPTPPSTSSSVPRTPTTDERRQGVIKQNSFVDSALDELDAAVGRLDELHDNLTGAASMRSPASKLDEGHTTSLRSSMELLDRENAELRLALANTKTALVDSQSKLARKAKRYQDQHTPRSDTTLQPTNVERATPQPITVERAEQTSVYDQRASMSQVPSQASMSQVDAEQRKLQDLTRKYNHLLQVGKQTLKNLIFGITHLCRRSGA